MLGTGIPDPWRVCRGSQKGIPEARKVLVLMCHPWEPCRARGQGPAAGWAPRADSKGCFAGHFPAHSQLEAEGGSKGKRVPARSPEGLGWEGTLPMGYWAESQVEQDLTMPSPCQPVLLTGAGCHFSPLWVGPNCAFHSPYLISDELFMTGRLQELPSAPPTPQATRSWLLNEIRKERQTLGGRPVFLFLPHQ